MITYRLYYCHQNGKQFAAEDFGAVDDDRAIERARSVTHFRCPVFELWAENGLVHRELSQLLHLT
jgi:hypothetical protein